MIAIDASTGKRVERCNERLEFLIATLSKAGTKLILPTPVLTESLDLPIVAIARVERVHGILSDDSSVKAVAGITGMQCRGIADLPLPPSPDQQSFKGI